MKLALFDFDGVLAPTFRIALETMRETVDPSMTEQRLRDAFDEGKTSPIYWVNEGVPFFEAYNPRLLKTQIVPGMADVVRSLQERGVSMAIVSSSMDSAIEHFLEQYGLRDAFERIYGASVEIDKQVKMRQALLDFGVDADDVVFITDTLGDIRDAASVGIRSIGVTWGYQPRETLEKGNPWKIVETPEELGHLLDE